MRDEAVTNPRPRSSDAEEWAAACTLLCSPHMLYLWSFCGTCLCPPHSRPRPAWQQDLDVLNLRRNYSNNWSSSSRYFRRRIETVGGLWPEETARHARWAFDLGATSGVANTVGTVGGEESGLHGARGSKCRTLLDCSFAKQFRTRSGSSKGDTTDATADLREREREE